MHYKVKNLSGLKFGKFTVISFNHFSKYRDAYWLCKCSCGNERIIRGSSLVSGLSKSCRCVKRGNYSFNKLYGSYRRNAYKRNYTFKLTKEQFKELTIKNCHYCGIAPFQDYNPKPNKEGYIYNGIDRKNNSIGYTVKNTLPCCGPCNKAKGSMKYKDFICWLDQLVDFRKKGEFIPL